MPINQKANEAGVFSPSDLALLRSVFNRTEILGETEVQREIRVSRIIAYFLDGIFDETLRCAATAWALKANAYKLLPLFRAMLAVEPRRA